MSERDRMVAGEPYDALDPDLVAARAVAQATVIGFNNEPSEAERSRIIGEIIGTMGPRCFIAPPFFCDYGTQIHLGEDVFVNAGAIFLDCAAITVGDHSQFGPGVQVLTADHPREPELRLQDVEYGRPVAIGANCWIGAGAIVCPGVTIGDHSIVGAGSVVVRDLPERVMAAGNPCRVIREI